MRSVNKNTWKYIAWLEEQKNNSSKFVGLQNLRKQFDEFNDPEKHLTLEIIKSFFKSPLEAFLVCVELGIYPPPEVMYAIADSFNLYLYENGELDLETVFFGKPIKGVGNEASRVNKVKQYEKFFMLAFDKPEKSQIELAEKFILDNDIKVDAESFLRSYRRYLLVFKAAE
ncbi:hypothetical protein [Paraglaciecola sp.]|uniref:hypothetical protein n=1 Tax=Paraglaciecola sp. TaxID=1920173 RepID=UPI0030F4319A